MQRYRLFILWVLCIFADGLGIFACMIKQPVRNRIVEHWTRLGDASVHDIGNRRDAAAQTYHYHDSVEVVIVKRGWAEGLVGELPGKLRQGMVVVLGGDVPHCVLRASDDCSLLLVHIPSDLLKWNESRFPELSHGIAFVRACKSGVVYDDAEFAAKITRLAGRIASAEGFMRMSLLMRLLHVLSTTAPTLTLKAELCNFYATREKESSVDRAYRYLYEHFREQLTLSDLASYAGLHQSALCRSFKRASGYTIGQFCTRLRMEYACNLLLTTELDVSQIAYQSGYNSYPHFCMQFRKSMNMSPSEYRLRSVGTCI